MKLIFFILIVLLFRVTVNICMNHTYSNIAISYALVFMERIPSSHFPNSGFLNFLLYGHTDTPYSIHNLLDNLTIPTTEILEGYAIIGNDYKLGGFINIKNEVTLPVPGQEITSIPFSLLPKYFPKGYIIKQIDNYSRIYFFNFTSLKINGSSMCVYSNESCSNAFLFVSENWIWEDNTHWHMNFQKGREGWYFFGYIKNSKLNDFNSVIVTLTCYRNIELKMVCGFPESDNTYFVSKLSSNNASFYVSVLIDIPGYNWNVSFQGYAPIP